MPDNKSVANSNNTAGEAVSKCSTPCCKVPEKVPEKGKKVPLDKNNQKFIEDANKYFDDQINNNKGTIDRYEKKNLAKDKNFENAKTNINRLTEQKAQFKKLIDSNNSYGDDFFTLANVIYNEAGTSNPAAKNAVAHAYLNRVNKDHTENVCRVREPEGAEVSHYKKHNQSFGTRTDKQPFLNSYISSMEAAEKRLDCKTPDPTCGATNWLSPKSLSRGGGNSQYRKEYDKYFPNWAISNNAYKTMSNKEKSAHWNPDYKEITVPGVSPQDFLFYKGVK